MATYTHEWSAYKGGPKIRVKASKDASDSLRSAVGKLANIANHWRELTGVIGEDEHGPVELWALYGSSEYPPIDPDAWRKEFDALVAELASHEIGKQEVPTYMARAKDIFNRHVRTVDKRETSEERNAKTTEANAVAARNDAKRAAKTDAFRAQWAKADEEISWGANQMAIYLQLAYDSHYMSNYFDTHASWGERLLLGVVPKGARTESMARSIVAKYADLAGQEYTWHTENYSGGHGNYLKSAGSVGEATGHHTYGGTDNPALFYEISFQDWAGKMVVYKDWPGQAMDAPAANESVTSSNPLLIVNESMHTQKNVPIWLVKIAQRVDRAVYDQLASQARRYGGQWSRFSSAFLFYDASKAQSFVQNAQV